MLQDEVANEGGQAIGIGIVLVRLVRGRKGTVDMAMEAVFRFDYGRTVPWVTRTDDGLRAVAGPTALSLRTPRELHVVRRSGGSVRPYESSLAQERASAARRLSIA